MVYSGADFKQIGTYIILGHDKEKNMLDELDPKSKSNSCAFLERSVS